MNRRAESRNFFWAFKEHNAEEVAGVACVSDGVNSVFR